ncbi:MAG: tRNA dihydrouridine synthase DusB [Actinomycetes bacterium]
MPNAFPPAELRLGDLRVWPPVVLAPMAGVTNLAFRTLARQLCPTGLYINEMVTSRGLVEHNARSWAMIVHAPGERPRSVQLYGVDPATVGQAVRMLVDADQADHIDLNLGCPVPKVTRLGGGAALPWKRDLLRALLRSAVRAAGDVPVTVKMRLGIDAEHLTYVDAGRIAQEEGVAAVTVHARTAAEGYAGQAHWSAITRLVEELDIPVLGNGDVWVGADAARMLAETGAAGVVVGRGCLGRPWLFAEITDALAGRPATFGEQAGPRLGEVAQVVARHARLLVDQEHAAAAVASSGRMPDGTAQRDPAGSLEHRAVRQMRKHNGWYLKGFVIGAEVRARLGRVGSLDELDDLLGTLDADQPYPVAVAAAPRGRTSPRTRVALPEGWLESPTGGRVDALAECEASGG